MESTIVPFCDMTLMALAGALRRMYTVSPLSPMSFILGSFRFSACLTAVSPAPKSGTRVV